MHYFSANRNLAFKLREHSLRKQTKQMLKNESTKQNFNIRFDCKSKTSTSMESIEVNDPDSLTDLENWSIQI